MRIYITDSRLDSVFAYFEKRGMIMVVQFIHILKRRYLVAKEEGTIKMVDILACKIIGTGTVNITSRDGMMRALKTACMFQRHNTI